MNIPLWRFIPAAILIALGVAVMITGVIGVFRIRYVLNRMHAAAMGDSLGILLIAAGVMLIFGLSFSTLKILCVVLLFWIAAPACSHLLAGFEVSTNEKLADVCEIPAELHPDSGAEKPEQAPAQQTEVKEGGKT